MHDLPQGAQSKQGVLRRMSSGFQNADEVIGELIGVMPRKDSVPITPTHVNPEQTSSDIVVIGSGLAGLCAAIAAAQKDCSVLVLDLGQEVGGLTRLSSGLVSFADPSRQERLGLIDSAAFHARQTLEFGHYRADKEMVFTLCQQALSTAQWLEELGIQFDARVYQKPRTLFPRGHLPLSGSGSTYVEMLTQAAASLGVRFALQHELTSFEISPTTNKQANRFTLSVTDLSTGRTKSLHTQRLILACGGFSSDTQMLCSQDPRLARIGVIATLPAVAHVHRCAAKHGILMTGLGFVQKEVFLPNGDTLPAAFRNPSDYIALDTKGQRFMREDLSYSIWLEELINRSSGQATLIASGNNRRLGPYWTITPNLRTLGQDLGIDPKQLSEAIRQYNQNVEHGFDPLGKSPRALTRRIEGPDYMGAQVQVRVLTTLGGIRITPRAEVLNRQFKVIKGLFAAGDSTGGIHGMYALNGNLLLSAMVFGRQAGISASE